jgi:DNA-binding GntR family transcriptional regulator
MRPNLPEEVAARIREKIFSGRLRPGTRIDQGALAGEFGVSRVPVREALISLEREGLIDTRPRRGSYVWSFGPDDLRDQYEVFGLVSAIAAERAARHLTPDEVDELRRITHDMADETDAARLERLNDRFHAIIARASRSRRVGWLLGLLGGAVPRGFEVGGWEAAARHHEEIVDRLAAGDADGSGRAMREHIRRSGEHAIRVLTRAGFWSD